jgi:hypothetical protein
MLCLSKSETLGRGPGSRVDLYVHEIGWRKSAIQNKRERERERRRRLHNDDDDDDAFNLVPIALATNWTTKNFKSKLEREGEKQIRDIPSGVIPTLALISKINAGVCKCSLTKLKTFPNRQRIDDLNFCAFVT